MFTEIICRIFIKNAFATDNPQVRLKYGLLSGWVGIAVNAMLFVLKLGIGLASGSIAIATDAVNNLSDAGSCAITVLGFKLSAMPADNAHPFGHGRIEYIAGVVVSVIILAVGFSFLKEAVMKIFQPSAPEVGSTALLILAGTILFKLWLYFFYRKIGKKIDSQVILANAVDSLSDILGTSVVILAVFCSRFTAFPIDGCAGLAVSVMILIAGIKVLKETTNPLLGGCPDPELVEKLRQRLLKCPGIKGVHDIILHNYGPNQYFATAHAEMELNNSSMSDIHDILEAAEVDVAKHLPIHLLLHCDPFDAENPETKYWRSRMENAVSDFDAKFKLYDFRLEKTGEQLILSFHLLTPRKYRYSFEEISTILTQAMQIHAPNIQLKIVFLHSFI